ncbi:MAG: hypothetical protein ACOYJZ_08750 [Acutalibacter sp.]|jgi:hypothetical protein
MSEFTQVATIPKTAARCKAEGIGLSEAQLRVLCKRGELKHTKMGHSSLIYWPNLIEFLENGSQEAKPPAVGKIRRIEE